MRYLLLLFIVVSCSFTSAQDTIIRNNSDKIIAKIIEISPTEVKYQKFEVPDTSVYIELKSNINMIVYHNGSKDSFPDVEKIKNIIESPAPGIYFLNVKKINERELHKLLSQTGDDQIIRYVNAANKAKPKRKVLFVAVPFLLGAVAAYSFKGLYFESHNFHAEDNLTLVTIACVGAAIACPIMAIAFDATRLQSNKKAIKLYNEKF